MQIIDFILCTEPVNFRKWNIESVCIYIESDNEK